MKGAPIVKPTAIADFRLVIMSLITPDDDDDDDDDGGGELRGEEKKG